MATTEIMPTSNLEAAAPISEKHDGHIGISELITAKHISQPGERRHSYITGLYGVLAIESFIWTYFSTFIPALVSSQTDGPAYQTILRAIFSVPFWNTTLIGNFFIILSLRNVAVTFLEKPTGQSFSGTVVRRMIRMPLIICMASGMATLIFSQIGVEFITQFKNTLPNESISTPAKVYNGLAAVNSLFNFFWITTDFQSQAANAFWPTATLWVQSIIYYQSFTTYFLMIILPFTRPRWHFSGLALFALGSFWMESWGWYSATGLLLADIAVNSQVREEFLQGFEVKDGFRIPYWIFAAIAGAAGIAVKYIFTVIPRLQNSLLVLHPYLDLSENYSASSVAAEGSYARFDDWLLIVGIMLLIELFPRMQKALSSKPLVFLGQRAFSKTPRSRSRVSPC